MRSGSGLWGWGRRYPLYFSNGHAIMKYSKNRKLAKDLLRWMHKDDNLTSSSGSRCARATAWSHHRVEWRTCSRRPSTAWSPRTPSNGLWASSRRSTRPDQRGPTGGPEEGSMTTHDRNTSTRSPAVSRRTFLAGCRRRGRRGGRPGRHSGRAARPGLCPGHAAQHRPLGRVHPCVRRGAQAPGA